MKIPTSYEVSRWPEFVAFAKRLGIPGAEIEDKFPWLSVTIQIGPEDETVKVTQVFLGMDKDNSDSSIRLPVPTCIH